MPAPDARGASPTLPAPTPTVPQPLTISAAAFPTNSTRPYRSQNGLCARLNSSAKNRDAPADQSAIGCPSTCAPPAASRSVVYRLAHPADGCHPLSRRLSFAPRAETAGCTRAIMASINSAGIMTPANRQTHGARLGATPVRPLAGSAGGMAAFSPASAGCRTRGREDAPPRHLFVPGHAADDRTAPHRGVADARRETT